jgi:hypothetical protein
MLVGFAASSRTLRQALLFIYKLVVVNNLNMNYLRNILLIIFVFLAFNSNAQNKTDFNKRPVGYGNCEDGNKRATSDFNAGNYNVYSYGLSINTDYKFSKYYRSYMLRKYKIKIGNQGCVVTDEITCYSKKMRLLLENKFGDNFLTKSRNEARLEYEKA